MLRYDQRGHGASEATEGAYSFTLLIQDLMALFDALEVERADLIGISMGGMTAMGAAQSFPERVRRLVVADATGASTKATAEAWRQRMTTVSEHGMAGIVDETITRWFPRSAVDENVERIKQVRRMILQTDVLGFIGCASALCDVDFASNISAMGDTTLFVVGSEDGVIPAAMARLAEQKGNASVVELAWEVICPTGIVLMHSTRQSQGFS